MSEREGFLSRWSRRKRAASDPPPPAAPASQDAAPPADAAKQPAFDPASLPPLESLTAESDFAAFLREEVPAALQRAALRRAWTLDPAIRDFVGPAEYAWDYNAPGGVPGFSLDLGGDVERLIAQAVGLGEARPMDNTSEAPPPVAAAGTALAAPGDAQPPLEHARGTSPDEAPNEPALEAPPAPEAPVAVPPVARRRHGGALPS